MHILHLNTHDTGGASNAAMRLHSGLRERGFRSSMMVLSQSENSLLPGVFGLRRATQLRAFLDRIMLKAKWKLLGLQHLEYCFWDMSLSHVTAEKIVSRLSAKPDVIILHWVSNFLSPFEIANLSRITDAPVIWNLLDMGAMTGGCHYSWGCRSYCDTCGNCPAISWSHHRDATYRYLARKSEAFRIAPLTLVAPSGELFAQASGARVFRGKFIKRILLGIDPEKFHPGNQRQARAELGIPSDRRILFFGASSLSDKRKGFVHLQEALRLLKFKSKPPLLLIAGSGLPANLEIPSFFEHRHLGLVSEKNLIKCYQASDAVVCPSLEDSGPLMINEAILCGRPVICFDVGVSSDLVIPGETGWICPKSSNGLAEGIRWFWFANIQQGQLEANCRQLGLEKTTIARQVREFEALFSHLFKEKAV